MTNKIHTDLLRRKYHVFSGQQLNEVVRGGVLPAYDEDAVVYIPYSEPDDHLDFPSEADFSNLHHVITAGLVRHEVERERVYGPEFPIKVSETEKGFSVEGAEGCAAVDLQIFSELDWHGECFSVMQAHGWYGPCGDLAQHVVDHVRESIGPAALTKAKLDFRENWQCRIAEQAAVQLLQPLSRLWYAVNMMALYYCHQDDLRLGYLWAEYQMRMRIETNALRGEVVVKSARDGGLARRASTSRQSRKVIAAMEKLVAGGQSITNAARLTAGKGLGASPEANRKLWARHRK